MLRIKKASAKNISLIILHILLFETSGFPQTRVGRVDSSLLPILAPHYLDEFTLDKSTNPALWESQRGAHVGFGSEDELYFRTEVPLISDARSWTGGGWRGERLNAQLIVWSADTLEQVRFRLHDLVGPNGQRISRHHIRVYMVRYVLANYPYGSDKVDCGGSPYPEGFLMPDRFEQFDRFDLPGKTVRPVWLTIDIPAGIQPGHYKGTVEALAKGYRRSLDINVEVEKQWLPAPHDWQYRLDLWQNPWVVAWDNHLQPWSEEHKLLLKKHLKLYADAGGKYITTYAVNSPWSDNSYTTEGGMIESTRQKNGDWNFDYAIFDQYVELAMSVGI
ncbi:MAG TPA: glycoside hydrolase domain-containing protein, partial [Puia sp.]|nr:glycoside hydrolase domain-containing protein [Puia sp.]